MSDPARELRRNLLVVFLSFFALWGVMLGVMFATLPPLDHARFEVENRSGRTIDELLISDDMTYSGFRATPAKVAQLLDGARVTITTVAGDTGCPRLELVVDGTPREFSMPGMTQWGEFSITILEGASTPALKSLGIRRA